MTAMLLWVFPGVYSPLTGEPRRHPRLAVQRAMHRTLVGDLEELARRRASRSPSRCMHALDAVDLAVLGLALGAIVGVDLGVHEVDADASATECPFASA